MVTNCAKTNILVDVIIEKKKPPKSQVTKSLVKCLSELRLASQWYLNVDVRPTIHM